MFNKGFSLRNPESRLVLRIDGKKYTGYVDSPEFIAWVKEHSDQKGGEPEEDIAYVAGFMTALLGVEQAKKLFNGVPRSYAQYMGLLGYVLDQTKAQGLAAKIAGIGAKYSREGIL